mgnify:FL=1
MKKSEIKNGAILMTRNGMHWFKVDNVLLVVDVETGVGYHYMPWDAYDEDMKYPKNPDYDIVGVDNDVDNGNGQCNGALAGFLKENTVFTEVNNDPIVTEEVHYILKFLLEFTSFEYVAKDGDGTHEIYLYKFEPKKVYELNSDGTKWYWAGVSEEITNLFVSEEMKIFFDSLDPNRVYKIEDLVK